MPVKKKRAARDVADELTTSLDFLIRDPVRTVLLHRSGVPVLVPSPERFAVHKLIVATRRERLIVCMLRYLDWMICQRRFGVTRILLPRSTLTMRLKNSARSSHSHQPSMNASPRPSEPCA